MSSYHLNTYQYSERTGANVVNSSRRRVNFASHKYIQLTPEKAAFPRLEAATGQSARTADRIDDLVGSSCINWMNSAHSDWNPKEKLRQHSIRVQALVEDLRTYQDGFQGVYINGQQIHFYATSDGLVEIQFKNRNGKHGVISEQPNGDDFTWDSSFSQYPSLVDYTPEQQAAIKARNEELSFISTQFNKNGIDNWLDDEMLKYAHFTGNTAPVGYADVGVLMQDFTKIQALLTKLEKENPGKYKLEDWSEKTAGQSQQTYLRLKVLGMEPYSKHFEPFLEFRFYEEEIVNDNDGRQDLEESTLKWVNPYPKEHPHISKEAKFSKALVYPIATGKLGADSLKINTPNRTEEYLMKRLSHLLPTYGLSESKECIPLTGDHRVEQQRKIVDSLPVTFVQGNEKTSYEGQMHAGIKLDPTQITPQKKTEHLEWKEALMGVKQLFEVIDVPFWLDAGTALGAYRYQGGAIMPWDHDADISCLQADFDRISHAFNCSDTEFYELYKRHKDEFPILNTRNYELQNWSQSIGKWYHCTSRANNKNYLRLKMKKN